MDLTKKTKYYLEDTVVYLDNDRKQRILSELYFNAFRTIKSVYLFKYFDEYVSQLQSDKNEDKKEIYRNASYYEKLIDYVKMSIAFETYNKAVLLDNGFIVHQIKKNSLNANLFTDQQNGIPIRTIDFLQVSEETSEMFDDKIYLTGFRECFATLSYSITLTEKYQGIIKLDKELCYRLKEINEKRNQLHFFTDFKGTFELKSHIKKWRYIMINSIQTIETKHKNRKKL